MSASEHTISTADLPRQFHIAEERLEPSGAVLSPEGELDMATAPLLRERLSALIDAGVSRLVVDLQGLSFMDSMGMAALLHSRKQLGDEGRMAIAVAPDSYTRLIFEVAGLPQCLDLFETRDEAVAHAAG